MKDLMKIWTQEGLMSRYKNTNFLAGFKQPISIAGENPTLFLAAFHGALRAAHEAFILERPFSWRKETPKQPDGLCISIVEELDYFGRIVLVEGSVYVQAQTATALEAVMGFLCIDFPHPEMMTDAGKMGDLIEIRFSSKDQCDGIFASGEMQRLMWDSSRISPRPLGPEIEIRENLLGRIGALQDTDEDFQVDQLRVCVVVDSNLMRKEEGIEALFKVAAYAGMQSLSISYPFFQFGEGAHYLPCVYMGDEKFTGKQGVGVEISSIEKRIWMTSDPSQMARLVDLVFRPKIETEKNFDEAIWETFNAQNTLGEGVYYLGEEEITAVYATPKFLAELKNYPQLEEAMAHISLKAYTEDLEVWHQNWTLPWEGKEAKKALKEILVLHKDKKKPLKIEMGLSENKKVRASLQEELTQWLMQEGFEKVTLDIFNAYKQGFSWISEKVLEQIEGRSVDKVKIGFKPFLSSETNAWVDEEGARPSYGTQHDNNPNRWFDLPIRRLQELYPIDDEIADRIGVDRSKISFYALEEKDSDYLFEAFEGEHCVYREAFCTHYGTQPYLASFPDMGLVHPTTGWVKVFSGEMLLGEQRIETDLEKIWRIYQDEILLPLPKRLEAHYGGPLEESMQPFFKRLDLDICLSETDEKLRFRNDWISSLDTFHEDIYFVGLDFFKHLGQAQEDLFYEKPGLIYPVLHQREKEDTHIDFRLILPCKKKPCHVVAGKEKRREDRAQPYELRAIKIKEGREEYIFEVEDTPFFRHQAHTWQQLGTLGQTLLGQLLQKNCAIQLVSGEATFYYEVKFEKRCPSNIERVAIDEYKPITYEAYIQKIQELREKGHQVYEAAKSFEGHSIYAVDLSKEGYEDAYLCTPLKLLRDKPSFLINNRHHANEVSSTGSAFQLIDYLTEGQGKHLLERVSVHVLPLENVDGGKKHDLLSQEHPEWIFHIARYNAVGYEFCRDYFKDTPYEEAKALPRVWHNSLPDVVVDNHGVPTHEWAQQFSGYVSPWFRGFWLPRALFYGYFWYVDDDKYPHHKAINQAIQEAVAHKLHQDDEIRLLNEEWANRFETYAHRWMPKTFPADYYLGQIYYWFAYPPDKKAWHVSHRYPWITAVDWTTEVADETAQGDYLKLCEKAHYQSDIAGIELLAQAAVTWEEKIYVEKNFKERIKRRKRPLRLDLIQSDVSTD